MILVYRRHFQVLVIPFRAAALGREYAVLLRQVERYWQWVAGGGEDDEDPITAARRELDEELGAPRVLEWWSLDVVEHISSSDFDFSGRRVISESIPEYAFAAELDPAAKLTISDEHLDMVWVSF
ncbi:MAG: NUDIX domain-containing protein [Acidimicrobiia bacterium]